MTIPHPYLEKCHSPLASPAPEKEAITEWEGGWLDTEPGRGEREVAVILLGEHPSSQSAQSEMGNLLEWRYVSLCRARAEAETRK